MLGTKRTCLRCKGRFVARSYNHKYCGSQRVQGSCSWLQAKEATALFVRTNQELIRTYKQRWETALKADPKKWRSFTRRRQLAKYGLTEEQYDQLLKKQRRRCAICRSPYPGRIRHRRCRDFVVDHDHRSGRVRGLLCFDCNIGLGMFEDDANRLVNAARYLTR